MHISGLSVTKEASPRTLKHALVSRRGPAGVVGKDTAFTTNTPCWMRGYTFACSTFMHLSPLKHCNCAFLRLKVNGGGYMEADGRLNVAPSCRLRPAADMTGVLSCRVNRPRRLSANVIGSMLLVWFKNKLLTTWQPVEGGSGEAEFCSGSSRSALLFR